MSLAIRQYGPEDLAELWRIDRDCFPIEIAFTRAELRFYASHRRSVSRVAHAGGRIVGFVIGLVESDSAHVITLDVVAEMRRRKVGTTLMTALHEELERRGVSVVFLEVDTANRGALRFYEQFAYEKREVLKGYYNGRSDAYRMVRVTPVPVGS